MRKEIRPVPMAEFTALQKRVLIELLHPDWKWRSKDALVEAIEDEREKIDSVIADDLAQIIDRKETAKHVFDVLHRMDMLQTQEQIHYLDDTLEKKTWHALAPRFLNNRRKR